MLYEEGHVCDPEREYKTLLTPKTIKMVKEFIEDYDGLENWKHLKNISLKYKPSFLLIEFQL